MEFLETLTLSALQVQTASSSLAGSVDLLADIAGYYTSGA